MYGDEPMLWRYRVEIVFGTIELIPLAIISEMIAKKTGDMSWLLWTPMLTLIPTGIIAGIITLLLCGSEIGTKEDPFAGYPTMRSKLPWRTFTIILVIMLASSLAIFQISLSLDNSLRNKLALTWTFVMMTIGIVGLSLHLIDEEIRRNNSKKSQSKKEKADG